MIRNIWKLCLIALILSSSAYASPFTKKITLACNSTSPDIIVGSATVSVCAPSSPVVCTTGYIPCGSIQCDSGGTSAAPSVTISCSASFKIQGVIYSQSYTDYDANSAVISSGSTSGSTALQKGSVGFSNTETSGSDSVYLEVK